MYKSNSIIMRAPKISIFETAADFGALAEHFAALPQIRFLERSPNHAGCCEDRVRTPQPLKKIIPQ
jgi:hypothetical protein